MEETNLIVESVKFMILGMGVVFAFLIIMVYALKLQARLIAKYFPVEEKPVLKKPATTSTNTSNNTKIAAIVAAVQHHKNLKG